MSNMPNMLAYTVQGSLYANIMPYILVGQGTSKAGIKPDKPIDDSYWFAILDRTTPQKKVAEFVVPGTNNSTVPAGLDNYLSNPQYIFTLATQYLSTLHVPQGPFYDYLVKYGAGRELQRLEQMATSLGCGSVSRMSYILAGQCGPHGGPNPSPPSYEASSTSTSALLLMSLMPLPSGPPYSLCDSYTFIH